MDSKGVIVNAPTIETCENAIKVYEFLKENLGADIVDDPKEFEAWFERMVWHVKECNRLSDMICDDAISRADLIDAHYNYCNEHSNHPDATLHSWSLELMKNAPPVASKQKSKKII